jgi:hypothetical protein
VVAVVVAATAVVWQVRHGTTSDARSVGTTSSEPGDGPTAAHSPSVTAGPSVPSSSARSPSAPATTVVTTSPALVASPAPSQGASLRPRRLVLPSGTAVPVHVAETGSDGALRLPTDVRRAGWWDGSARLGDPLGSIVIAAHVDSLDQGLGVFAQLLSVRRGDDVVVRAGDLAQRFEVVRAGLMPKTALTSTSPLYSAPTSSRLVLITCGGAFNPARGGYQDNFVVIAEPQGALRQ